MIEQAVEAERAAQQKADAFVERMDSMVEARAAEMTIEEAEGAIAEEASSTNLAMKSSFLLAWSKSPFQPAQTVNSGPTTTRLRSAPAAQATMRPPKRHLRPRLSPKPKRPRRGNRDVGRRRGPWDGA